MGNMPELLDEWLKTTTEEKSTTDLLSGWLATTEPEPEEEPTWWEKAKGFGEWLFPKGIQDLPRQYGATIEKGGMAAGEAMTWLTRLLPGNEDRKPYAEQTTAEQAWTVAQAGATIGAVTAAVGMGIDTVKGLKTYLKGTELQKGYKEIPYTKEMVAKGEAPKVKPVPIYKTGALKGKPIPGAKATILRPGVEVTRVVKPAKPEIATAALKQLSQKVQAVEVVKKADIVDDFTLAIRDALTAKTAGTQATQTAITNAAQTISNDVIGITPAQFSGEFAVSLIDEAIGKIDSAVNILATGMEYTEPKYTRPIEEEIVEKELAKPLEEVSPYGEKFVAPEPEVKPTVVPEIAPKEDLTLAMRDTKTGEIITATPDEKIHTDMIPRLRERISDKDMEPGWIDSKGKFYDVWSGRRTLAGFEPTEIAPKAGLPPSIEQEVSMGGSPLIGTGIELTDKEPITNPTIKTTLGKAVDAVSKTFSVYTRIKKEYPEAYKHFREFKGGQELGLINAEETNKLAWGEITKGEALAVQRAIQMPEKAPVSELPGHLQQTYTRVKEVLEDRKQQLIDRGKLEVGWPQSYINRLETEKDKLLAEAELLTQKTAINKRQSRITEIDELIELLGSREFFPAGYIERVGNQPQILKLLPEGVYRGSQIRSKFRAGKIVPDIDTAIEWGLEPMDPRAGLMQYLAWFEAEKNKWILYQGIKDDSNLAVKPTKTNPAPEWFVEPVGISDLEGYMINPLVGDVLDELNRSDKFEGITKAYAQVAKWGKMASFHNPVIMGGVYDPQQGFMAAGLGVLNPVTYSKSVKSVYAKDEFYKECLGADLFPKPVDLGPQKDMDKFVMSIAKQMDKDTPAFTAWIEKATGGEWDFKGKTNTQKMIAATKGTYNAIWNVTWALDAVSRETTVKTLMARGWTFEDAVERARFYHADYGDIPASTRRFANFFMWTPSYQASMAKVYGNMLAHPIKEKGPIARLIGFQLAVAAAMAVAGYSWQRGNKFVKDISKEEQDVISSPGPLYWLNKNLARNPLNSMYWQSSVPINIIWSMERNFDGLGNRVYDPKANKAVQIGQLAEFAISRYFRPLETMRRLNDGERSLFDRLLSLVAISKYQRKPPKEKKKAVDEWWVR